MINLSNVYRIPRNRGGEQHVRQMDKEYQQIMGKDIQIRECVTLLMTREYIKTTLI